MTAEAPTNEAPDIPVDDDEEFEEEAEFIPATSEGKPPHSELETSSKAFWAQSAEERERTFARLRREDPVSWQRPVEEAVIPDPEDPGYWAVTKHADIVTVSQDHETFISGQGVLFDLLPPIFLEMSQSFLALDPPRHDNLRKLVGKAFTPKQVRRIEDQIRIAAREVVDDFINEPSGEIDLPERCSSKLPIRMWGDMFGVPHELRETTAGAAADVIAWADPETLGDREPQELQVEACTTLHDVASELVAERRENPTEDLLSGLAHAEVDGEQLDDADIGAFFVLLSVAGTDTTRHTTTFMMQELERNPEQVEWLKADFDNRIDTAIEEFVRHASVVTNFRRTAVKETELGGKTIKPGDKVVLFYSSGNRDEEVFDNPNAIDLSRSPNPHVGFGGGGKHFCLGNQLAKSMLRAIFRELLFRLRDWECGEPELLGTNFMRAAKRMPFRFTPQA